MGSHYTIDTVILGLTMLKIFMARKRELIMIIYDSYTSSYSSHDLTFQIRVTISIRLSSEFCPVTVRLVRYYLSRDCLTDMTVIGVLYFFILFSEMLLLYKGSDQTHRY